MGSTVSKENHLSWALTPYAKLPFFRVHSAKLTRPHAAPFSGEKGVSLKIQHVSCYVVRYMHRQTPRPISTKKLLK